MEYQNKALDYKEQVFDDSEYFEAKAKFERQMEILGQSSLAQNVRKLLEEINSN